MKAISTVLCACAVAPNFAAAQSSVTMYGVVDIGAEYVNNLPSPSSALGKGRVYRLVSGAEAGSRLGFRGVEDLGGGLSALFALESGFNADDGTFVGGSMQFNRASWVGIGSPWGQISLGRHTSMANDYAVIFDPIGRPSRYSSPAMDPAYVARVSNSVRYGGTFGNTKVSAQYGLGEVVGSTKANRYLGAMATSVFGDLTLGISYEEQRGATLALTNDSVKRASIAGIYNLGSVSLLAGYTDRRNETKSVTSRAGQYWLGARFQVTPWWYVSAGYYGYNLKDSPNDASLFSVFTSYTLSKRTDIYAHIGVARNKGAANMGVTGFGTTLPGSGQQGVVVGVRHLF